MPANAADRSLSRRPLLRLFALCALYFAQGVPWGFMAITLPAYLADRGLGTAVVGATMSMTTWPYTFKFVWGPVIDSFTIPALGRRRPWILLAQLMMALTVIAMIAIPDLTAGLTALSAMIFIHNVFNSMQDVAVDALAVDLLDERERGRANGLMYGSKYLGGFVGGAGMATVIDVAGLRSALVLQTAVLLAIMLVPLLLRERPPSEKIDRPSVHRVASGLIEAFTIRSAAVGVLLAIVMMVGTGILQAASAVLFTQELGWDAADYAQVVGGPGLWVGFGGSVLGGFLADRVGHRRLAASASIMLGLLWVVFALGEPLWRNETFVYSLFLLEPLCQSVMTVSLFALFMDISSPRVAGSQFTAYMALFNLSTTIGLRLVGWMDETLDWSGIYLIGGAIQIAATALIPFIDPGETRRKLGE
ncbi:MAG TPA: MFS transporter [Kofleriaceae bacterium]|nr:MFS transporter [Kofleriaceae bacterium]